MAARSKGSIRPKETEYDALRCEGLKGGERRQIVEARCGRTRLMDSRRWIGTPFARALAAAGCPCGGGAQTMAHVLFDCGLCKVQRARGETAAAMKSAKVDARCADWAEVRLAMEGRAAVAGTNKEGELVRKALGVMADGTFLSRRTACASGARGACRMVRAAEQETAEQRTAVAEGAVARGVRRRLFTAWRAVVAAVPRGEQADVSELRRTQLRLVAARLGGGEAEARAALAGAAGGGRAGGAAATAAGGHKEEMLTIARLRWAEGKAAVRGEEAVASVETYERGAAAAATRRGFLLWRAGAVLSGDAARRLGAEAERALARGGGRGR